MNAITDEQRTLQNQRYQRRECLRCGAAGCRASLCTACRVDWCYCSLCERVYPRHQAAQRTRPSVSLYCKPCFVGWYMPCRMSYTLRAERQAHKLGRILSLYRQDVPIPTIAAMLDTTRASVSLLIMRARRAGTWPADLRRIPAKERTS